MGYKYDRDDILEAAVAAVLEEGVGRLTFGRLAKRIGINDRSIVYYFPTKRDLVTEVVLALGDRFQGVLDDAFGEHELDMEEVLRRAWPVLASADADPVFKIYFELTGLAVAGIEPFDSLAPALVDHWVGWLAPRIVGDDAESRRAGAVAAVALVDGLLLLRHTIGADVAEVAAARLGVV